jgi:hypothetical protein
MGKKRGKECLIPLGTLAAKNVFNGACMGPAYLKDEEFIWEIGISMVFFFALRS